MCETCGCDNEKKYVVKDYCDCGCDDECVDNCACDDNNLDNCENECSMNCCCNSTKEKI